MENLIHIAVGGSSGWGKSVALRSLAFQMATCDEDVKLCFVDSENMTFTPFQNSDRLLYPVADNDADALSVIGGLAAEMGNRKALFAKFPVVEKLSDYNQQADEKLPYICLFADEITALLKSNKTLEQMLTLQILRARKYGILAILGGQSWKADVLDTTIRGQFSSTIHFHARDKSSSAVLLGSGVAADITQRGIAFAVLPGRPMVEFLSPNISLASAMREIGGTGPATAVEMPALPEPVPDEKEAAILDRHGESYNQIALDLLGSKGGHQTNKIKDVLAKFE
jgi:DNA segregation ATPase FtsK/SpoIIIE-like protein